jgi:LysM repeat protein
LVLGIIVVWLLITRGKGFGLFSGAPTGITESTQTSTEIPSPTTTSNPSPTPTLAGTATLRPLLGLETPLGIDHKFLIHQIQEGDSFNRIAGDYDTTVAALLASNYRLPSPLIPGWAIVVPLNFVDRQGFPAFEVYSVTEEISLEDLVIQLSVDLNEFKYYNALDDNFIPRAGDWLLVPRPGSPTPTP